MTASPPSCDALIFFFRAGDGIRGKLVTGVQTCALPISLVDKVDVTRVGKVRRSRLYFLRDRVGKAARLKAGSRARFEELTQRPMPEDVEEAIEEEVKIGRAHV